MIVKDWGEPKQLPKIGVTIIVLEIGIDNVLVAVNEFMFPVPEEAKPMFVLKFVQV